MAKVTKQKTPLKNQNTSTQNQNNQVSGQQNASGNSGVQNLQNATNVSGSGTVSTSGTTANIPGYTIAPPPGLVFKLDTNDIMLYPTRQSVASTFRTVDPFALEWNDLVAYPTVERWLDNYKQRQSWYQDLVSRAEKERAAMMGQQGRGAGIQLLWGGGGVGGGMVGRSRYGGEIGIDIPPPPEFKGPPDLYKNTYVTEQFSAATTEAPIKGPTPKSPSGGHKQQRPLVLGIVGSEKNMAISSTNPISKTIVPYSTYPIAQGASATVTKTSDNLFQLTSKADWDLTSPKNNINYVQSLFNATPQNGQITLTTNRNQNKVTIPVDNSAVPIATMTNIVGNIIMSDPYKLKEFEDVVKKFNPSWNIKTLIAQYEQDKNPNKSPFLGWVMNRMAQGVNKGQFAIDEEGNVSSKNPNSPAENAIGGIHEMIKKIVIDFGFKNPSSHPLLTQIEKNLRNTTAYDVYLTGNGQFNYERLKQEMGTVLAANIVSELTSNYYRPTSSKYDYGNSHIAKIKQGLK